LHGPHQDPHTLRIMGPLSAPSCAPGVPSRHSNSIPSTNVVSCEIDEQETTSPCTKEEDGEQAVSKRSAAINDALLT